MGSENIPGKISTGFMDQVIYPNLGAKRKEVLVGPSFGLDTCVIDLGGDQALVASTDPLSLIPQLGVEDSAWMSVNLLANDLSTSGIAPQYLLVDLSLPPGLPNETLTTYWGAVSNECGSLGISIVGGNTGKFEGCDLTIIGAGTTLAIGPKRKVIVASGARPADSVIVTKGAAISSTGILAKLFPNYVRKELGRGLQEKAAAYFRKISASRDALLAASLGTGLAGISAIHDVAEGGVFSSMIELAAASSLGMEINPVAISLSTETRAICNLFQIDPFWSLGEGALVITCNPRKTDSLVETLKGGGVDASKVGTMLETGEGVFSLQDGQRKPLIRPPSDPYWGAYYSAVTKNWN
jgi:hydrogenase expression/formation protein HypE